MKGFCDGLLDERLYALNVNGRTLVSVILLAGMEKEFAYGYLATEGIVPPADIDSVMVEDTAVSVLTTNPFKVLLPKKSIVSGCGGTASYLDPAQLPVIETKATIPKFSVSFDDPVVKAGGFMAAVSGPAGQVAAVDLSQTAAIDKAVGAAVMQGAPLADSILLLSGKVTADCVRKALKAGIPFVAAVYAPTRMAADLAGVGNLTLVSIPERHLTC
jgi:FdhD protein